jgi:quercetin dioxygenase-like cupin family protein
MIVRHHKDAKPEATEGPVFTGAVSREAINGPEFAHLRLGLVKFEPGARTVWHTHTFEQGLVIVEGKGIVATEDAEHVVVPGDVVAVPANEKHWHGAGEKSGMAHISIGAPGETKTLEPVTEVKTKDV